MKLYVAVDIGCIECGEDSACLGVFENQEKARDKADMAAKKQAEDWHGQHSFEVFEVDWSPETKA